VAIEHDHAAQVSEALRARGYVVDFRQPDVVRLAPIALYTTYQELWQAAQALREIIDTGAHLEAAASGPVT
jgi:kynureninase